MQKTGHVKYLDITCQPDGQMVDFDVIMKQTQNLYQIQNLEVSEYNFLEKL